MRGVESTRSATARIRNRWQTKDSGEQIDLLSGSWSYLAILSWLVFLGATVRLPAILYSSFPANDGGMFMQAVLQLQNAHFALPHSLNYNGLQLPYAYPPLGFYVAGLLSTITHQSVLTMLRFIPVTFSIGTILAFILFAQAFLDNQATVIASCLAFALVPHSHDWEVMGGGLARSIGFFFAVLAIWQAYLLFSNRSRQHLILTVVFSSLASPSHLEMALFVATSLLVIVMFHARSKKAFVDVFAVAVGVLVLTSPWWLIVVSRFGVAPFISAAGSSGRSISAILSALARFNWGGEPMFPVFAALAALGIIICCSRRRFMLPFWAAILLVADPRDYFTETMVPLSILVGMCVAEYLFPLMARGFEVWSLSQRQALSAPEPQPRERLSWLAPVVICALVLYGWVGAMMVTATEDVSLSRSDRQAMEWIRISTPPNSRFAVLDDDIWGTDRTSEWFPVLTDRISVASVQGYEWLPNVGFSRQAESYKDLQQCAATAPSCITAWADEHQADFNYIYVARRERTQTTHTPCRKFLVRSLTIDPSYTLVFQDQDAAVFRVESPDPTIYQ